MFRTSNKRSWLAALVLPAVMAFSLSAQAAHVVGVETYYVPLPEGEVQQTLAALNPQTTSTNIVSVISIASSLAGNTIIYDHWEDGYEADIEHPLPGNIFPAGSTQIWGDGNPANGAPPGFPADVLGVSDVIVLQNTVQTPVSAATIQFNGRDKFTTALPVAVTRVAWATTPGTVLAGAVEVFPTSEWGTAFEAPVGENILADDDIFELVTGSYMAQEDGTVLDVDLDKNGVIDFTTTLNQGESFLIPLAAPVFVGASATTNKPVQLHAMTGDIGAIWESRWAVVLPSALWSNEYFVPVSTRTVGTTDPTDVWVYNPNAVTVTVTCQAISDCTDTAGATKNSAPVAAGTVERFRMPNGSGARFSSSGENFYAIATIDSDPDDVANGGGGTDSNINNRDYDWGIALVPTDQLSTQALVGFAPSIDPTACAAGSPYVCNPPSGPGSPVWVMSTKQVGSTIVYIDFDGDPLTGLIADGAGNLADRAITLNPLERAKVFDNDPLTGEGDNDNTGTLLYTLDNTRIAVAWGQDPESSVRTNPYFDAGTYVPALPLFTMVKNVDQAEVSQGATLTYTIQIQNIGRAALPNVQVEDELPPYVTYVANSTAVDSTPLADAGATLFPLDEGGANIGALPPGQLTLVTFQVTVNALDDPDPILIGADPTNRCPETEPQPQTALINNATVTALGFVEEDDALTCVIFNPSIDIEKATNGDDADLPTGPFILVGGDVTWTYVVTNTGDVPLTDVTVTDNQGVDVTCERDTLAVLPVPDSMTCTASGTAVEGQYANIGTAVGTPPAEIGGTVTDTDPSHYFGAEPLINIEKTVYLGHDGGTSCSGGELVTAGTGSSVTYCFEVTNTGNTSLDAITLVDGDLGISRADLTLLSGSEPLAPNASLVFFLETTMSVDLLNTAATSGNPTDDQGNDIPGLDDPTDDDTAEVNVVEATVDIQKTVYLGHDSGVSCEGGELVTAGAGTAVTYCFKVTNTSSEVYLSNVQVNDTDVSFSTTIAGPLAPGAMTTVFFETTLSGDLLNTAMAEGEPTDDQGTPIPGVPNPTDDDTAEVNVVEATVDIQKTVYLGHDSGVSCEGGELVTAGAGTAVTYCFKVTNTSSEVYLSNVQVNDTDVSFSTTIAGPLAPGAMTTVFFETTLSGDLLNTAMAEGEPTDDQGTPIPGVPNPTDDDTAEVNVVEATVDIQKTVYLGHDSGVSCEGGELVTAGAGTAVTYCFKVTNTSSEVYLSNVQVNDTDVSFSTTIAGPLAPGAMTTVFFETTLSGDLLNTAMAEGEPTDDQGTPIPGVPNPTDDDTAEVNVVEATVDIQKTVYLGHDSGVSCEGGELVTAGAGTAVTYCFKVTNTSSEVYLSNVQVNDTDVSFSTTIAGPLAPGAMTTVFFETTLSGDLLNTAMAEGEPTDDQGTPIPGVPNPTDDDTAEVNVVEATVDIQKTVYLGHDSGVSCEGGELVTAGAGTAVTYCFKVTNTSSEVYLSNVQVNDTDVSFSTTIAGPLAPGAMTTVFFETTLSGDLLNTAMAEGEPTDDQGTPIPGVPNPTDDDTAEVVVIVAGGQGCTPGYWKQPQHFGSYTAPLTPDTLFSAVFEDAFPGKTLLEVLSTGGGGLNALGRHTVAALLNSASPDVSYDVSADGVIDQFNAIFPDGSKSDYNALKDVFSGFNEQGCPLGRNEGGDNGPGGKQR